MNKLVDMTTANSLDQCIDSARRDPAMLWSLKLIGPLTKLAILHGPQWLARRAARRFIGRYYGRPS